MASRKVAEINPLGQRTSTVYDPAGQSLATVDFHAGDTQVTIKVGDAVTPVKLVAAKAGDPYKAEGYEMTGTAAGITLTSPGKPEQACKA